MKKFLLFLRSLHPDRTSFLIGIIFYFLFFGKVFSQSQWYTSNPYPTLNDIYALNFPDASTGYGVGNFGTIIKTTNGGNNWVVLPCITHTVLRGVSFRDGNTGVVVGGNIVFRTTDGGANWNALNVLLTGFDLYYSQYIGNETFLLTGTDSTWKNLIFRSTNAGINWNHVYFDSVFFPQPISFINQNDVHILIGKSLNNGNCYFRTLKTTDGGGSWNIIYGFYSTAENDSINNVLPLSMTFLNTNTGYISGLRFICKTTDGGNNWTSFHYFNNLGIDNIKFLNYSTGIGAGPISYLTTNAGQDWNCIDSLNITGAHDVSFINNNKIILAGYEGKIYSSSNAGLNWTKDSKYITNEELLGCVLLNPSTALVGSNYSICRTTNSGLSWIKDTTVRAGKFCFYNGNTGIAINTNDSGVYKSTNGGLNWTNLISQGFNEHYKDINFINSQTGMLLGQNSTSAFLKITTNGGLNWQVINTNIISSWGFYSGELIDNNTFYVGSDNIYKTTNAGSNWIKQTNYSDLSEIDQIKFLNPSTGFCCVSQNDVGGRIIKTTNGGNNWISVLLDSNNMIGANSICFATPNKIIATFSFYHQFLDYGKIYTSTDMGNTWTRQYESNAEHLNSVSFADSVHGIVCGQNGMILFNYPPGSFINVKNISTEVPEKFDLKQNYPNPFNPSTIIRYQIKDSRFVTLKVYDILGREIETLVNEFQKAGTYETQFPNNQYTINQMASGVYFYKLVAGDFIAVKKMILMK
jgi:photosystem II stability/assembly factor-like uncharacterized protein